MNEIIDDLKIKEENIHKLKGFLDDNKFYGKTTGFAESLFKHFEKRGELSDKQWHWVLKLVDQVQNPKQEEPEKKLPNINGVYSLLRRAVSPKNKSFPKLWLRLDDQDIKISKASNKSKHRGKLFLSNGKWGYENIYFGRIETDGDLYLSKDGKEVQEKLIDLLNKFGLNWG